MRFLLDTHVWLWLQVSPTRIRRETLRELEDPAHGLVLSTASSWEIAIKYSLGNLREPPAAYVVSRLGGSGISSLAIEHRQALAVATLPWDHRDPFDRLLVVQALADHLVLVTADEAFRPYDVEQWAA